MPRVKPLTKELIRHKNLSFGRYDAANWYVGHISTKDGVEKLDSGSLRYYPDPYRAAKAFAALLPNEIPVTQDLALFAGRIEAAWAKLAKELKTLEVKA